MVDLEQCRKIILESAVVIGLVVYGIISFFNNDPTNGAWALGLAGGYAFKNGYKYEKAKKTDNGE